MELTLEYKDLNYKIHIEGEEVKVNKFLQKLHLFALNELNEEDLEDITIDEEIIR